MRRGVLWLLAGLALLGAACEGGPEETDAPYGKLFEERPIPFDAPPRPNAVPVVSIGTPGYVHAGIETLFTVLGRDRDDAEWHVTLDFGDDSPRMVYRTGQAPVAHGHTYARPGTYTFVATMTDPRGATGIAELNVDVLPRKVLFVQGYGSESRCPEGGGFASRVASWVPELLASEVVTISTPDDIVYASYSGRWCDGGDGTSGAYADYGSGDTCGGIDDAGGIAERLRTQIDALAPAKVTIIGHSMGGLAAAYVVGSDPDWARERVASVVTFDSPLSGVPQLNMAVLRLAGDCDFDSDSNDDLSDSNEAILAAVAGAGEVLPFYNLDATEREGVLFVEIREPVPGERTHLAGEALHWQLGTTHNGIWTDAPRDAVLGPAVRAVVGCAIELVPGWRCQVE